MSLKLTVVGQTPVHGDLLAREASNSSVALARACDELGDYRYWLAEHHNSIQFANHSFESRLNSYRLLAGEL